MPIKATEPIQNKYIELSFNSMTFLMLDLHATSDSTKLVALFYVITTFSDTHVDTFIWVAI